MDGEGARSLASFIERWMALQRTATGRLDRWYSWAIRSRLEPIKEAACTAMLHRDSRLAGFESHMADGLIESINSLIQVAKAKARGYRSTRTLKAMACLIAGKLDLKLPT